MTLPERLVELHEALAAEELPHAFGGAIALAYWTLDPRGTSDIDVNIFVPAVDCAAALRALPAGIAQPAETAAVIHRDGQTRLWWDETPVDVFLNTTAFHDHVAERIRWEPFAGTTVPFLGCSDLAVFKASFDRTKDWADVEEMLAAGTLDLDRVLGVLVRYLGPNDPRVARLLDLAHP